MSSRVLNYRRTITVSDIQRMREERNRTEPCLRRIEKTEAESIVEELPLMQQIALLRMLNSTLARGVATRLISVNECQDRPGFHDYRALIAHGFAHRGGDDDPIFRCREKVE